jgi:hypothetical protein
MFTIIDDTIFFRGFRAADIIDTVPHFVRREMEQELKNIQGSYREDDARIRRQEKVMTILRRTGNRFPTEVQPSTPKTEAKSE